MSDSYSNITPNQISEEDNKRLNNALDAAERAISSHDTVLIGSIANTINGLMAELADKYEFDLKQYTIDPNTGRILRF